jgi:hypothetical protein
VIDLGRGMVSGAAVAVAGAKKKAASCEAALSLTGFSSELGFEHELQDSAGSRRALEVPVRAAWR